MRAPLSIVIPTLNAEEDLPETLAALMEGLAAGLVRELVISDGGSHDGTGAIAEAAGATLVTGAASRGGQLRRGVEASGGDWLLLLHADTHLSPGWTVAVGSMIEAGAKDQAGYFKLRFRSARRAAALVAGWANLRSRVFGLPYGDQGLLVPRALLDHLGGVPDLPLMEDVALARALRGKLKPLPVEAATSFVRYERAGVLNRGGRNLGLLMRYLAGASPQDLSDRYRG
ncbi:TIGR04283 family arsenosugar biosynthesis glycosyltransferase [Primorskyibacter sp. S187A]|uniref:TIGR04283 family arsenosugar biosynthesis glycosyltransferase n=1 Tax=Primorskyibacter sp. S187A TaxID=3415130 RepID=UPI003C7BFA2F